MDDGPPFYKRMGNQHILYDPEVTPEISRALFDWNAPLWQGEARKPVGGRGAACFVSDGRQRYLLRHYMRGGMLARWVRDHYCWLGLGRSRAWREWSLLAEMFRKGLPVPRPAAARVVRTGVCYAADLLVLALPGCRSLAEILKQGVLSDSVLESVGRCIRHFHNAQIDHADLNAHNILIDEAGEVYLIDFDRGQRRASSESWKQGNLKRLLRSLSKLSRAYGKTSFDPEKWRHLIQAYEGRRDA